VQQGRLNRDAGATPISAPVAFSNAFDLIFISGYAVATVYRKTLQRQSTFRLSMNARDVGVPVILQSSLRIATFFVVLAQPQAAYIRMCECGIVGEFHASAGWPDAVASAPNVKGARISTKDGVIGLPGCL
jgi:hypothetical protein